MPTRRPKLILANNHQRQVIDQFSIYRIERDWFVFERAQIWVS